MRRIAHGEWTPAANIPSEAQLSLDFGVSVGTVRRAIEDLVQDGFLFRTQGKGTYVRRADFGNALARFFRHTDASGETLHPRGRMLSVTEVPAHPTVNATLQLDASAPLLQLLRLRLVADTPMLYEEIYVGRNPFAALTQLPLDAFGDLLYPLYERVCGQRVFRASETIRFDQASEMAAHHLGIPMGEPVVVIDRLASGMDGLPLECRRSVGLAQKFSYSVELR